MSAGKSAPFCVVPAKGNLKCTSHAMPFCLLTIGEGKVTVCSWKTASFSFRETTVAWAFWLGGKMGLLANKQKKERICLPTTCRNCFFIITGRKCWPVQDPTFEADGNTEENFFFLLQTNSHSNAHDSTL